MAFLAAIKKRTDLRAKGVAKEADDRDPTTITDIPWIGELDPKRFAELPAGGKWMLFYDHDKIWSHWQTCQHLYRNGELKGVSNMKVSTVHPHHSASVGVIILYCGPPDNETKVKQIGRTILLKTGYTNLSKKMFYKTDTQTLSRGRAGSHRFQLPIPQTNFDKLKLEPSNSNEYKQQYNEYNKQYKQQYTRKYLQTLSKSQIIDIVMKLQPKISEKQVAKPRAPMAPMAPQRAPMPAPMAPMAPALMAPWSRAPMPAPLPGQAPMAPMRAPLPNQAPLPLASLIAGHNDKKHNEYERNLRAIKSLGFERVVIIKRDNFEMLASLNKRLDSKKKWDERIEQQSVLNGRQKLVVLNWFRKEILLGENIFNFQTNWGFPPYILNIITLHYLENIDDKQQLMDDWSDNYKPCFYFYQQKWNILLRKGNGDSYVHRNDNTYQSLVCLKGKECLIAKQCKTIWIISKVRIMAKKQMNHRYQWMSYKFTSAPQAYNQIHNEVFERLEDLDM